LKSEFFLFEGTEQEEIEALLARAQVKPLVVVFVLFVHVF
jgi:hypothetical protein